MEKGAVKYKWIADLIAKEFPDIKASSESYSHGQRTELCLEILGENGESIRQCYEIDRLYLEDEKGNTFRPDAFMIEIDGEWESFIPEIMHRKPQIFEETDFNKDQIRHWCKRLMYWKEWHRNAVEYKKKRLEEKGLPSDNVQLWERLF